MMEDLLYKASDRRYSNGMEYERCGRSGVSLPRISLGLWQNFGETVPYADSKHILLHAFDRGIVSFDLANNYGPPYGSAETTFGRVVRESLRPYRDEIFVSTKAGYDMWPGPYGNYGSRKHLMASLDQSLRRMGLEYVDLFYIHRYDPVTPIEETLQAIVDIVKQGKALYAGISRWPIEELRRGAEYLKERDVPCLVFQDRLNMLDRHVENGLLDFVEEAGIGFTAFSTLAEGVLTNRYLRGVPAGSRADKGMHLKQSDITPGLMEAVGKLDRIAEGRGQSLAQMATAWVLAHKGVTSILAGCSRIEQLDDVIAALDNTAFSEEELSAIDAVCQEIMR